MPEEPDHAGSAVDEEGRNPTQQRIDAEGASTAPGDASWVDEDPDDEADPLA